MAKVSRVVVFLQENKTTDFYFAAMKAWGAAVADHGNLLASPPNYDQPHDRNAWVHYASGDYPGLAVQLDTDAVIPYYSWLAKQFVFCDHHFGAGSNSTSGHMLAVGGQVPTFKNPPFTGPHPVWDLPSVFTAAAAGNATWAAFPDQDGYPTKFYTSTTTTPGNENVHPPNQFIPMAKAGELPQVVYAWSPGGYDEHPPHVSDPQYVSNGQDLIWQRVQAVIDGGGWDDTVFILTWDDWGGYADSVPTPDIETLPDALHPKGFQAIGGSRIPLIMFGGKVQQHIDTQWHSHASIPKTIIDLLGLPPLGVQRVDAAPSLAAHVDDTLSRPMPPVHGTPVTQPPRPAAPPPVDPTSAWKGPLSQPMPALVTLDGSVVPAPTDGLVRTRPPTPPKQHLTPQLVARLHDDVPARREARRMQSWRVFSRGCFGVFVVVTVLLLLVRPDLSLRHDQISELLVGDWSAAAVATFLTLAAGAASLSYLYWCQRLRPTSLVLLLFAVATAVAGLTAPTSAVHNVAALTAFLAGPIAAASATWLSPQVRIAVVLTLVGSFALWPLGVGLGERATVYGEIVFFAYLSARI